MERSIEEIQQSMVDQKNAEPELNNLNSPSQTAIWKLWTFIIATAINLFEQLITAATSDLEQIARDAIAGTVEWLQRRTLEFQYDASNPQVVSVIDGRIEYGTIDESLRIVTRAAVKEQVNGRVLVKVAKGTTTLSPLDSNELNALTGYLDKVSFVGMPTDLISLNADRLRFEGEVFYSGEYVETEVKTAVKAAISSYLSNVSINNFNGKVVREKLINAIQEVPGIVGLDTLNIILTGRPEQSSLGSAGNVNILREYESAAGYIIEEDTSGNTFDDTITMTLSA